MLSRFQGRLGVGRAAGWPEKGVPFEHWPGQRQRPGSPCAKGHEKKCLPFFAKSLNVLNKEERMKVNRHAPFDDPQRTEVEARVIHRVETDPEPLFELYRRLPESLEGRYVNSDLFKEIFPEYSASPAHRTLFNVPVHNSAAVLANELFHRQVAAKDPQGRRDVLFITGIPGAGKSTSIQNNKINLSDYKVIYEGQLANFEQAKEKIDWCLQHECEVTVYAFHQSPEVALQHTFTRFNTIGRGASLTAMSNIQGNLGNSIEQLSRIYEKRAFFCVVDLRVPNSTPQCGKESIQILKSEGDANAIRSRLEAELERWRISGRISEPCFREAAGKRPLSLSEMQKFHEEALGSGCQASQQPGSADGAGEKALVTEQPTLPTQVSPSPRRKRLR